MFKYRNVIFERMSAVGYLLTFGIAFFAFMFALVQFPSHEILITTVGCVALVFLISTDIESLVYASAIVLLLVARDQFDQFAMETTVLLCVAVVLFIIYRISKPVNHGPIRVTSSGFFPDRQDGDRGEVKWSSVVDVYFVREDDDIAGMESAWILHLADGGVVSVYVEWPFSRTFLRALTKYCSAVDSSLARSAARKWSKGRWRCVRV